MFVPWGKAKTWWLEVKYCIIEADGMPDPYRPQPGRQESHEVQAKEMQSFSSEEE